VCSDRRGQLVHPAALLAAFVAGPALGAAGTWWFGTPGTNPGADPGTNPGADLRAGADPDTDLGADPRATPGTDPGDPPPDSPIAPPRRRAGYRAAGGVAAAVLVFVAIAVSLVRVTDPAALAGERERPVAAPAGSPARTANPAPLATADDPALNPAGGGSGDSQNEDHDDGAPGSPGTSTADQDVTNGDLDRAPDPFEVDVVRFSVGCAADGRTYVLTARVRGNQPVRAATVYWRTSPSAAPDRLDLGRVDRVTREGSRAGLRLPTIEWWVEATDVAGATAATGRRTATNPCR
jgi:hypothetical protein